MNLWQRLMLWLKGYVDWLSDMMVEGQRRQAWTDAYTAGVISREEYLANVNSNHRHKEAKP